MKSRKSVLNQGVRSKWKDRLDVYISLTIDHKNPSAPAPWIQLREALRRQVISGQLRTGDALMPARKLCEHLGLNRVTVDLAVRDLVKDGLLRSEGNDPQ